MRYEHAIEELRVRLQEAASLRAAKATHHSPEFRRWRYRVESLIRDLTDRGYRLPGTFNSPVRFYADPYDTSTTASVEALTKDISDTEIELQYLVDQFEKYGPPPIAQTDVHGVALKVPEHVTFRWLNDNVPLRGWLAAAATAVFLVGLGAAIGRTAWFAEFENWVRTSWPS